MEKMQKIYKIKNFQVNISACQGTYISLRVYFGCIFVYTFMKTGQKCRFSSKKAPKGAFFMEQVTRVELAGISLGS